jgi:hypothetical protein
MAKYCTQYKASNLENLYILQLAKALNSCHLQVTEGGKSSSIFKENDDLTC